MKTFETNIKFGGEEIPIKPGDLLPHAMEYIEEELSGCGHGQAYIESSKESFCRVFWGGVARIQKALYVRRVEAGAYLANSVKHIVDAYDLPTEVEQELVKVVGVFWEDQK